MLLKARLLVPSSRADVPGKVYIAGGGPGALDLLTLRAVRALGEADVVLLDHLAPQELAEYAPNALIMTWAKYPVSMRCRVTHPATHD